MNSHLSLSTNALAMFPLVVGILDTTRELTFQLLASDPIALLVMLQLAYTGHSRQAFMRLLQPGCKMPWHFTSTHAVAQAPRCRLAVELHPT